MRWHIVQHGLMGTHSHEYGEARCWAAALAGQDWRGYAHQALPSHLAAASGYAPAFAHAAHDLLHPDPLARPVADYLGLASAFAAGCARHIGPALCGQDTVVVTYSTHRELYGAAQWLHTLPPAQRPRMAFVFHLPDLDWQFSADRRQMQGQIAAWRHAASELRAVLPVAHLLLGATSERLAECLQQVLQLPVRELPLHLPLCLHDGPAGPDKVFDLILAGEYRAEKGSAHWVPLLQQLAAAWPQLRVSLQARDGAQAQALAAQLQAAGLAPHTHITEGEVDTEAQVTRLRSARQVLLPYDPARYGLRGSGVAQEAFMYGLPVVVPAHTWMADQVTAGRAAGVVFDRWEPGLMARATLAGRAHLDALTTHAQALAPGWRARAGAGHTLQILQAALT